MREMRDLMGIEVIGVAEPRDAVGESELVVTSGPILLHPDPTIQAGWIRPGTFASAVDFDSSWTGAALAEFDKVATDDYQQFHYYREHGYFAKTPDPYADLGEIVAGARPGRERPDERIIAINLGIALDGMALAPETIRRAIERGIGTWLPR